MQHEGYQVRPKLQLLMKHYLAPRPQYNSVESGDFPSQGNLENGVSVVISSEFQQQHKLL